MPPAPKAFNYIPCLHTSLTESNCFLQREIDDDEAIDSHLFAIREEFGFPVAQDRIIVAHEENRCFKSVVAGIADHFQHRRDGNAIFQRFQIGFLNGRAICNGIGER
jgi:hypothetical protein